MGGKGRVKDMISLDTAPTWEKVSGRIRIRTDAILSDSTLNAFTLGESWCVKMMNAFFKMTTGKAGENN